MLWHRPFNPSPINVSLNICSWMMRHLDDVSLRQYVPLTICPLDELSHGWHYSHCHVSQYATQIIFLCLTMLVKMSPDVPKQPSPPPEKKMSLSRNGSTTRILDRSSERTSVGFFPFTVSKLLDSWVKYVLFTVYVCTRAEESTVLLGVSDLPMLCEWEPKQWAVLTASVVMTFACILTTTTTTGSANLIPTTLRITANLRWYLLSFSHSLLYDFET